MDYTDLSQGERSQIQCYERGGLSVRGIAEELGRCPSTISRELPRNATTDGSYTGKQAPRQSTIRHLPYTLADSRH